MFALSLCSVLHCIHLLTFPPLHPSPSILSLFICCSILHSVHHHHHHPSSLSSSLIKLCSLPFSKLPPSSIIWLYSTFCPSPSSIIVHLPHLLFSIIWQPLLFFIIHILSIIISPTSYILFHHSTFCPSSSSTILIIQFLSFLLCQIL